MSITTTTTSGETERADQGRATPNLSLVVEGMFAFLLKGAKRLVQMQPSEMQTLKQLCVTYMNSTESTRFEVMETILELLLPNEQIGNGTSGVSTTHASREKVESVRLYIGKQVHHYRVLRGLTQVQLANKAKIPQSHVSRLEKGKHTPTHVTIARIAKALKVDPDKIDPGYNQLEG